MNRYARLFTNFLLFLSQIMFFNLVQIQNQHLTAERIRPSSFALQTLKA